MAYPDYIRERARQLRVEKKLSLDEIAERLALPKTTVYYWITDLPLARPRSNPGQQLASQAMQAKYARLREQAYNAGLAEYDELIEYPTFRDFVVLYIAEGYKRSRNTVALANSDPVIVVLGARWLRRFSDHQLVIKVQHHADQDPDELRAFWSSTTSVEPTFVRLFLKSNSGQLRTRIWRCEHGVASVQVYDTYLRARLQAWIDRIREGWGLDCGWQRGV
jgi:transcriptional regulator with XRE-family HTH domain